MRLLVDQGDRLARARSAISLGAAFALFSVVLLGYDAPASQAAGGLIDAVFGPGRVPAEIYYSGYAPLEGFGTPPPRRLRPAAQRPRVYDRQARRRVVERRKFALRRVDAPIEQRRPAAIEMITPGRNPFFRLSAPPTITGRRPALRVAALEQKGVAAGCVKPCPGATAYVARPASAFGAERTEADKPDHVQDMPIANALYADRTLRPGDTVVTAQGVRILRAGSRYPFREADFLSLAEAGDAPLANRRALNEIERALMTPLGRDPGGN